MSWLKRSVAAVKRNDPAARTTLEVLLTYHWLARPVLASLVSFLI